jgi:hypothetical protein
MQAGHDTAARKKHIADLLSHHPDGYKTGKWVKETIAGDIFWTNGKKYITSGQLLEEVGTALVGSGAISHSAYYGESIE